MRMSKETKNKIKKLLLDVKDCRDSDEKLIANFWYFQIKNTGVDPRKITAFDFLEYLSKGKLTSSETIRRTRAKLQEENIELRGKKYNLRKGKYQNRVRSILGYEINKS